MEIDIAARMAGAVGGRIAGKLGGLVWDEATLLWKFKDDVEGMKETVEYVNALMHDADSRQASHPDQGQRTRVLWMKKFKSAAYNAEDLLDRIEAVQLLQQNHSKIKLFFSSYNPFLLRFTIAHKMKKVNEALANTMKEGRETLGLVPSFTPMCANVVATNQEIMAPTIGDICITMVGRETERKRIMELLKSEAEDVISIIPIVGLGGMGKTTLAQAIFSDNETSIFDVRVWIYVSKKFDLQRIEDKILSTVRRSTNNETSESGGDSQSIVASLKTMLHTKRYLIVLDDMWEVGWENLDILKQMLRYGGKGSKIILTTRMQQVVDNFDDCAQPDQGRIIHPVCKSDQINLSKLSDDECWNVMQRTALGQDEGLGGLEAIGREIARNCAGLPLLARSLGFLLSQRKYTEAWEQIRDRKIVLGMKEDKEPLERLMLSYYYMPLEIKLCFTYCAIFPKGFIIASDHLVQQWSALGYIQSSDGKHCVHYLLGMSFLQISNTYQSAPEDVEAPIMVTMHDLVYDLATLVLDQELISLNDSEEMTQSSLEKNYCRHMQFINHQKQSIDWKKMPSKVRSLHFTECNRLQLQDKSFSKPKYLRVLDISGCSIQGKSVPSNISLPSSIHSLVLLRYLDASDLPITSLPKSLHKLQNMQTLILSNCALESLPDNIGSLLNLCYLDLSGNSSLRKLPVSFGELSALWFLNLSACSKLYELPESIDKLICLRHLDMSGCSALQKLPDKFGSLPKLLFLDLSSCSKLSKLPDSINLKSVEYLNLSSCHQLQSLPQNFGNLEKLKFLNLSDCYKVQLLPESFCRLKHLKDLDLSDCHDLKELPECFGSLSELQSLDVTSCSKLQFLPESFGGLSKLKHLNLSYCVRLENLPSSFCSLKLQVLYMKSLQGLLVFPDAIGNMTSLTMLQVFKGNDPNFDLHYVPDLLWRLQLHNRAVKHTVHEHEVGYGRQSSIVGIGKLACHYLEINKLAKVKHPEDAERAKLRDNTYIRELSLSWNHADRTENKKDIEVLENLVHPRTLEGFELDVNDLEKVEQHEDAERAKLRDNPDLKDLRLSWDSADRTEYKRDAEVLENLVPPRTLEGFELVGYQSRNFPNWMLEVSSYLPYLATIKLIDLPCESLPPLGMLPNLRLLAVSHMPNIMKIRKEFYGEGGACKKLRIIQLVSLKNLEEWWTTRSGEEEDGFLIPNLHGLDVVDCPKLKFLPYPPKSMHWGLNKSDEVLQNVHGFGRLSSSTLPLLASIVSLSFTADKWGWLQHFSTLEELTLGAYSWSLSSLPEATPCFPSLRRLRLLFSDLEMLPEWLWQLITLEELIILSSPRLTSLPQSISNLTALKRLEIDGECPILIERCKGEDAHKISHIPKVVLGGIRFVYGQPVEE